MVPDPDGMYHEARRGPRRSRRRRGVRQRSARSALACCSSDPTGDVARRIVAESRWACSPSRSSFRAISGSCVRTAATGCSSVHRWTVAWQRRGTCPNDRPRQRRVDAPSSPRRAPHLAAGGARQLVDELERPSARRRRAATALVWSRRSSREGGARGSRGHDDGDDPLAPLGVRLADHEHLGDAWVGGAATRSTATGHTFSPPVMIRSPMRPWTVSRPSSNAPGVAGRQPARRRPSGRRRRGRRAGASGPAPGSRRRTMRTSTPSSGMPS